MISVLDDHVGRVLRKLTELNLDQNTLVVFTSDNGTTHEGQHNPRYHLGGCDAEFFNSTAGLKGYKGSLYEGGIRVPMIARYPGRIPANQRCDAPTYFANWFPTLCDAAGLDVPNDLDGESFWPELCGAPVRQRDHPMLWVSSEYGGQVAVRLDDYKILRRNISSPELPSKWEVYNLAIEKSEQTNLTNDKPELVQAAMKVLYDQTSPNEVFPITLPAD